MIRAKVRKDIIETLEAHTRFEHADFKLETSKIAKGVQLKITYLIDTRFYISFVIPSSITGDDYNAHYMFSGSACPGPVSFDESFSFKQEHEIYSRIKSWQNAIWEEVSTTPLIKLFNEQQQQIDEIYEKLKDVSDELFSKQESEDIKTRLTDLEKKLTEEIENNTKDKDVLQEQINQLHTDISTLQQTVDSFTKKSWFKSFASKVFRWTKDGENRKMIGDGYKVLKEFLPADIKNTMP